MKIAFVLATLASAALADSWRYCACQQATDSSTLVDGATTTCCTAGSIKAINGISEGSITSELRFPGNYCYAPDKQDGDQFYSCCKSNGAGDSACINRY
ncbi:putative histone-lysine N-methyltransferase (Ash1) [Lasiodiplodia theobromae]|uniref:putative histone-lysine N-methyltransferase (Ash1) n=1 Tax=Lasiodiplodia theobromae TaxID=45133 RepID=UPI0015C352A9|nr:putative histone-lysine N-methyltransferase (Ash1) [Lasiodiplodia theobromae]KAF4543364.1 putative histone-lysine N-methyltransferase (Ash1) [Lasiodiplodia theobromae]